MKRLHLVFMVSSLLAATLFLCGSTLAQSSDALVVDENGNVGIGTTSPSQPLHVLGNTRLDGRVGVGGGPAGTYQFKIEGTEVGVLQGWGYQRGLFVSVTPDPSKWTESYNQAAGIGSTVFTRESLVQGKTLDVLYGGKIQYGAYTGTAGTISLSYGLFVTSYLNAGTLGNMYDIYLASTGTGGTLTGQHYGMYQAASSVDNYFAGKVGIGASSPSYKLDVVGDIHCTGKLTSDGGNDPPYVLYNNEARKTIADRVTREVPPDKLGGAVVFFNGETSQMEIFLPSKGEFQNLRGERLASITPITSTFEVEDRYYFDGKTGEIKRYKVRKALEEGYRIKEDYALDPGTGAFYRILRNENGEEISRVSASKDEAVGLLPAAGR
jgi:hypothetical protein